MSAIRPVKSGCDDADVLAYAALASSPEGQDPIDTVIRAMAAKAGPGRASLTVTRFTPFDPAVKMAEAIAVEAGREIRVVKGAPAVVATVAPMTPAAEKRTGRAQPRWISNDRRGRRAGRRAGTDRVHRVQRSAARRFGGIADRVALARRAPGHAHRRRGRHRGDRRARDRAHRAGLSAGRRFPRASSRRISPSTPAFFPEQKFNLVKAFQQKGHAVGMCGDGANDAPALRQAQMGIAVSTATDVAKAAAGVVLTEPGLGGIVACIKEGRSAFQRVLTYTLMILINKWVTLIVLGAGLIITGHAVLTPLLQALSMLTNDFVTMARAADRARPSPYPNAWRVRNLTLAAVPLGFFRLLYLVAVLGVGWYGLRLSPGEMQTLTFVMLVFAGQGNVYVLREHGRFWSSRPAPIMLLASLCDVLLVAALAAGGVLMSPLPIKRDRPARRDDDRLHLGDGSHQARGVSRACGSIEPTCRGEGPDPVQSRGTPDEISFGGSRSCLSAIPVSAPKGSACFAPVVECDSVASAKARALYGRLI